MNSILKNRLLLFSILSLLLLGAIYIPVCNVRGESATVFQLLRNAFSSDVQILKPVIVHVKGLTDKIKDGYSAAAMAASELTKSVADVGNKIRETASSALDTTWNFFRDKVFRI